MYLKEDSLKDVLCWIGTMWYGSGKTYIVILRGLWQRKEKNKRIWESAKPFYSFHGCYSDVIMHLIKCQPLSLGVWKWRHAWDYKHNSDLDPGTASGSWITPRSAAGCGFKSGEGTTGEIVQQQNACLVPSRPDLGLNSSSIFVSLSTTRSDLLHADPWSRPWAQPRMVLVVVLMGVRGEEKGSPNV